MILFLLCSRYGRAATPSAGGEVHVTEIAKATVDGRIGGRGQRPARGHRLFHIRDARATVLRRRARVPAVDAIQVRAQAPGAVAMEAQVQAAVVLAGRRSTAPPPPDDERVRWRRQRLRAAVRRRDCRHRKRHLLGRVRTEPTAATVRLVAGRRQLRAGRQPGQDTHADAVAHGAAAAGGQEQDVHGHAAAATAATATAALRRWRRRRRRRRRRGRRRSPSAAPPPTSPPSATPARAARRTVRGRGHRGRPRAESPAQP